MTGLVESAALQLRVAKRLALRRDARLGARIGRLDDRLVFVVGSPRSGTTFLAGAIGSLPGFVDLGEVAPFKATVPELVALPQDDAARRIRRILGVARRVGLVGAVRAVEQTPEAAYLVDDVLTAYPDARVVHIVRDGRDVVCSLLERGWLSEERAGRDDAGVAHGAYARFWVEPMRRSEFTQVSDARRAAWAWRRYVSAARSAEGEVFELRYESLVADPGEIGRQLAGYLGAASPETLAAALGDAHAGSIGRYERDLTKEQLADVLAEAGDLLRELGYLDEV
ncbi:MAG TPA: sulfotransferase [Gaiellaceae bacterium]|nr:sulfotransferase [Gaiellaceae bacterium]